MELAVFFLKLINDKPDVLISDHCIGCHARDLALGQSFFTREIFTHSDVISRRDWYLAALLDVPRGETAEATDSDDVCEVVGDSTSLPDAFAAGTSLERCAKRMRVAAPGPRQWGLRPEHETASVGTVLVKAILQGGSEKRTAKARLSLAHGGTYRDIYSFVATTWNLPHSLCDSANADSFDVCEAVKFSLRSVRALAVEGKSLPQAAYGAELIFFVRTSQITSGCRE